MEKSFTQEAMEAPQEQKVEESIEEDEDVSNNLKEFGVNKTTLDWIDENVAIVTTRLEYTMNGETYNEFLIECLK